jgi:cytidine deaminase
MTKRWQDKLTASQRKHLKATYTRIPPLYVILTDQRKTICPCLTCRDMLNTLGVKL